MDDLREIAAYTERTWGSRQRREYLRLIDDAFKHLVDNPLLGTHCDEVAENLRKYPCESHVVFYELDSSGVFIIRVLHRKMDVNMAIEKT